MVKKKTVAVIFGGCSPEYEVSLKSACSIIGAINREDYDVIRIGITRHGVWYRYDGDLRQIGDDSWHGDSAHLCPAIISPSRGAGLLVGDGGIAESVLPDVVFPVLHGKFGEDGTVQGLCELAGLPVVGSGSAASALCMDKDRAHKLVSLEGIRIPRSYRFDYAPAAFELASVADDLKIPLFVKPVNAGSSIGITMVSDPEQMSSAVKSAFEYDRSIIIEENIEGFEAGCSVIGNDELTVGRVDEIELSDGFFTYEEKYTLKTSKIHMPARIDEKTERELQEAAMTVYRTLGCRGYARIDLFLAKDGGIVFNEANTIPGFTLHSRFPKMMGGAGMGFERLVDALIRLGIENG